MEKCSHPWLWIILDLVAFILVLGNCGQITKFTHLLPEGLGVPKNLQLRKKYKEVTLLFYCFSVGSYEYHVSESMASWGFFWKLSQRDGEKETNDRWLENKLRQSKQHVNYLCNKIHFWWSQRSRKLNNKLKLLWKAFAINQSFSTILWLFRHGVEISSAYLGVKITLVIRWRFFKYTLLSWFSLVLRSRNLLIGTNSSERTKCSHTHLDQTFEKSAFRLCNYQSWCLLKKDIHFQGMWSSTLSRCKIDVGPNR